MTTLETEVTKDGQKLTYDDGRDAGLIVYRNGKFYHRKPDGREGRGWYSFEAAQYDALAWASNEEAKRRYAE